MIGVSTMLSLWDRYRDRFKITTSYSFSGADGGRNEITIINLNKNPIILEYYELYWKKQKPKTITRVDDLWVESFGKKRIKAYDFHTLLFEDDSYFDWGHKTIPLGKLYIKLYIAGRKPIEKLVYDPNK